MSVETWVIASDFEFLDAEKALEAIKSYNFDYEYKNIGNTKNIYEAFELWNLSLKQIDSGNYYIVSNGDCPGDEGELFHAVSPYVKNGGYIELGVGEDEIITYTFNEKKCNEKSSLVGIDGVFHMVFIFTKQTSLSDCLEKLDKAFTYVSTKENKTCEVIFNHSVCASITLSCRGQELFKKFLYEQGQVVEAKIADGDLPRIEKLLQDAKCIVLVKFYKLVSALDFMVDYVVNLEELNNAKKAQGVYWESYLGLCEDDGIFCFPQEGYYCLANKDEPILNLDY